SASVTTTVPSVSVSGPTAPATELTRMTWSAGWGSTAAGEGGGSGGARIRGAGAHGVPDVRVGREQEGHVVGHDRIGAAHLRGPAEHARVGRRHVDHGRGARAVGQHGALA